MELNNENLNWLAGFLEGEGSFLSGPPSRPGASAIRVVNTDRDVVSKAASLMEVAVVSLKKREEHHKPIFSASKVGYRAVQLMLKLRPLMGERRKSQIDKAVASLSVKNRRFSNEEILEIREKYENQKLSQSEIASHYKVCRETINKICTKKHYGGISLK